MVDWLKKLTHLSLVKTVLSHLASKKTKNLSYLKKRCSKVIVSQEIILQVVYFKLKFSLSD